MSLTRDSGWRLPLGTEGRQASDFCSFIHLKGLLFFVCFLLLPPLNAAPRSTHGPEFGVHPSFLEAFKVETQTRKTNRKRPVVSKTWDATFCRESCSVRFPSRHV